MGSEEEEEAKWVTHYSSVHDILMVGDGDFSFSLSLAKAFGSASNIVATSLDTYDVVVAKYKGAKSNLKNLEALGATLMHGIDATKMKYHSDLKMRKFDRIVFNFPHAGFKGLEHHSRVIKNLVRGFFDNARHLLRVCGEVHISHKTGGPFCLWNLEELASKNSLGLLEEVTFSIDDYPGYNNKRGDGKRCDDPFPLGECSTFKFTLCKPTKKKAMKGKIIPERENRIHISDNAQVRPDLRIREYHTLSRSVTTVEPEFDYVITVNNKEFGDIHPSRSSLISSEGAFGTIGSIGDPYRRYVDDHLNSDAGRVLDNGRPPSILHPFAIQREPYMTDAARTTSMLENCRPGECQHHSTFREPCMDGFLVQALVGSSSEQHVFSRRESLAWTWPTIYSLPT